MEKKIFERYGMDLLVFVLAAILGLLSIIIPPLLTPQTQYYDSPLFPLIGTGIENLSLNGISFLFLSGIVLGFLCPKRAWLWGLGTMFLFPVLAFAEMIADPYSHNLWPFEFIIYGLMTIPGIGGAYTGIWVRKMLFNQSQ